MGQGQYGVKSAAERYFGISDLKQLGIGQIATLAAIPKGPSIYNPADNLERSASRRNLVLRIMQQHKLITTDQMTAAMNSTYQPPVRAKTEVVGASYMDAALQEAMQQTGLSQKELRTGGYTRDGNEYRGAAGHGTHILSGGCVPSGWKRPESRSSHGHHRPADW